MTDLSLSNNFTYDIVRMFLDKHYQPSENTRITTNFANLARGEHRQKNLQNVLTMINNRFNALAFWDNPCGDRYSVKLEIVSIDIDIEGNGKKFRSIEILNTIIIDHHTNKQIEGIVGNNFSSYVRDYDFSVLLLDHNKGKAEFTIPDNFGDLHGKLFQDFVNSSTYKQNFNKPPVICLSVSDNKIYRCTDNNHPILGIEYLPNESSLTEQYFKKMGLSVRYFMPRDSVAPLAFFFFGDLLIDYSNLELASTISTMETFQKIYRPEIYNANARATHHYQPNLKNTDHSLTQIIYDREERQSLAIMQGKFAKEHFVEPYKAVLEKWATQYSLK